MPAGRPRKPAEIKLLEGTFREDRDGVPPIPLPPAPELPPAPPKYLKGEALTFWTENVPGLVARGTAHAADAPALAMFCEWFALYRKLSRALARLAAGHKRYHQTVVQLGIAFDKWAGLAARFGLTPSDRAKLGASTAGPRKSGVATRQRGS